MKKTNILFVSYGKLDHLYQEAIKCIEFKDINLEHVSCLIENSQEKINDIISEKDIDIIVAGGKNASYAKINLDVPIENIKVREYDYIMALHDIRDKAKNIYIILHESERNFFHFDMYKEVLKLDFNILYYSDARDINRLELQSVEYIIGGGLIGEIAEELKIPFYIIYPSEQSIVDAIIKAKETSDAIKEEKNKKSLLDALISLSPTGIIIANSNREILDFNKTAEEFFKINSNEVIGKNIDSLFSDLFKEDKSGETAKVIEYRAQQCYKKHIIIFDNKKKLFYVWLLYNMSDFEMAKQKYQKVKTKKYSDRGLRAKYSFDDIIADCSSMKKLIKVSKTYASTDNSVMIVGESGVGKELFAQSIHQHSKRRNGPFVAINCAALSDYLLESELFGYVEGSFTGSRKEGRTGLFELADTGTIFLDEIGEIPPSTQAKLLRVVQEKEIRRIGDEKITKVDVRIISATNREIRGFDSGFRQDLMYRLNVFEVNIPPLRDRKDDVKLIFKYLLEKRAKFDNEKIRYNDEALEALLAYSWFGNVRELANVVERYHVLTRGRRNLNEREHSKLLITAIGEKNFLSGLNEKYMKSSFNELDNVKKVEFINKLNSKFFINKEEILSYFGISRTTFWRMEKLLKK